MVTASKSKHLGRPGKSRTAIPAQTGNWVLGKTIGAGSMGKVKLAERVEDGEQEFLTADRLLRSRLTAIIRLRSRLSPEGPPTMDTIRVEQIENEPIIRKRSTQHEKPQLALFWIIRTYALCETLCARPIIGICFLNM